MSTPITTDSVDIGASCTIPISVNDQKINQTENETDHRGTATEGEGRKPKRKTSKVWLDVSEVVDGNGKKSVRCNHCDMLLAISKGGPTTTYQRHIDGCIVRKNKLKKKGPGGVQSILSFDSSGSKLKKEGPGGVQSILGFDSSGSGSLLPYKYDKEAVGDAIVKMIMVHEYPFTMVEHKWFRIFAQLLNPKFEPVGRLAIRERAMKMYVEEKAKMKALLAHVGKISLTSDLWTSNQTKGYMCITGHYLDEDWKLQNRILNFRLFPPPHSGIAIADKMFACLVEWGIENKISTITLDNASSNDAAIQALKEQLNGRNALYFGGKIFHVRCCAHILNIMAQDGLGPLKHVIENVRESVKYITLNPSRLHKWNEVVTNLGLPADKFLILDCVTHWNSTFHMLERALILKNAFSSYASTDTSFSTLPSEEDWERVEAVCKFLSAFDDVTNIFSGHEHTTSNLYLPEIWKIRKLLDDMVYDPREFMKLMVLKMKEFFDKYWNECNLFMIIASVLDPRNKIAIVNYVYSMLYERVEVASRITIAAVRAEMRMLYEDYVAKEKVVDRAGDGIMGSSKRIVANKSRATFENWLDTNIDGTTEIREEIDVYLDEPVLRGEPVDFDVLGWWKINQGKYPILSKMARDILSIPVTTVPSKSAFSAGRRVISDDRCSLEDDTIEGLLCGSNWFQNAEG